MLIDYKAAAEYIRGCDNVYILTHQSPDGDCIGTGFALHNMLRSLGKCSAVLCSDPFPAKFGFITDVPNDADFEPETIIAVDVADKKLLGKYEAIYGDRIDLCIDHHISNTGYAERTLLGSESAAACEVLYRLMGEMGVTADDHTAACIYTGIATDTGCFKFENTSAETHTIAAELMICHKLNYAKINREMFDVKTRGMMMMESAVIEVMEYYLDSRLTMVSITKELLDKLGVDFNDLDGCAGLPLKVEGVEVGITIKEKAPGEYKISMRSTGDVNVSAICQTLGGGGHAKAAGCSLEGTLDEVKRTLVCAVEKALS